MEAHRPHYNLTFAILAIAGIAFALLQSLVAPALRTIQTDLHTTTTAVAWLFTGYLLAASIATPIVGRLGDMFGKKRMLVVTLAIVAVGLLVAALATSIGVLILGRVIQGAGGAIFPLAFAIIRDEFPRERIPTGIALISALLGVGGGLGIILAGPIIAHLSYHWLFWLPLIVVVAAAIAAQVVIPESPIRAPGRIDWVGAGLLTGWLVALLAGVGRRRLRLVGDRGRHLPLAGDARDAVRRPALRASRLVVRGEGAARARLLPDGALVHLAGGRARLVVGRLSVHRADGSRHRLRLRRDGEPDRRRGAGRRDRRRDRDEHDRAHDRRLARQPDLGEHRRGVDRPRFHDRVRDLGGGGSRQLPRLPDRARSRPRCRAGASTIAGVTAATIETNHGSIGVDLFDDAAP